MKFEKKEEEDALGEWDTWIGIVLPNNCRGYK